MRELTRRIVCVRWFQVNTAAHAQNDLSVTAGFDNRRVSPDIAIELPVFLTRKNHSDNLCSPQLCFSSALVCDESNSLTFTRFVEKLLPLRAGRARSFAGSDAERRHNSETVRGLLLIWINSLA